MKLPAYSKMITMGKEAIESSLALVRAKSAKKKAELELCNLEEQYATGQSELQTMCAKKDVDFVELREKMDSIDMINRGIRQMNKIISEMFPVDGK